MEVIRESIGQVQLQASKTGTQSAKKEKKTGVVVSNQSHFSSDIHDFDEANNKQEVNN
jgi:hypothetical protein